MARGQYRRWWKETGNVLVDRIVCPKCGANAPGSKSQHTLSCDCDGAKCFDLEDGELTWRRSPCPSAVCSCGWKGQLRSRSFESVYHRSRCRVTSNGWHDVGVSIYKNDSPGPLTVELRCKACGCRGHATVTPRWKKGRSKCDHSPNSVHDVAVVITKNETPGPLTIEFRCLLCDRRGFAVVDGVSGVAWEDGNRKEVCNEQDQSNR